ncbi:MAG TPA: glycoside hydrolase family 27 protein [Tepidisphaeraceae bacterium]|nr:glycoside hydrolase family 27 protein [Tepidisphaeraceae bacterium]
MGWNSWDCYGTGVTEEQTRANVDYMADKLKSHGWQYIIVDIQWYEPQARTDRYRRGAVLNTDKNGRLMPAPNRFPSAADGRGFKPLADYVHSKGLKFGIHLMRGIPRQAVGQNLPIWGTEHKASEIADKTNVCRWNTDMYGVDMSKPGAQEYYDSVLALLASWDVDYVKVDDLSAPNYHKAEVEGIRQAIDKTGRAMVLSTSPGATSLDVGEHIATHANLWRISNDFWDTWKSLKEQFDRCNNWSKFTAPGHWPDADMLPIGAIRQWRNDNWTRFTKDEQITLLTLWSICRSPLMMGGDMPKCDEFTLSLLTNDEVIDVNQHSVNGRQLFRNGDQVAWVADIPDAKDKYLALFNAADQPQNAAEDPVAIKVMMKDLGFDKECTIRDLWKHNDIGSFGQEFSQRIPYHGAGLYKVSPK